MKDIWKGIISGLAANWIGRRLEDLAVPFALYIGVIWSQLSGPSFTDPYMIPSSHWNPLYNIFPSETVSVEDPDGNPVDFEIFVLSQEYRWMKGKSKKIQMGGDSRSQLDIRDTMRRFTNDERVRRMDDIVFVGLASCEGDPGKEKTRALDRAEQLVDWFGIPAVAEQRVYSFSLGQYDTTYCSSATSESDLVKQRPVIVLGVNRVSDQLDEISVRTAMEASDALLIDVRHYSDFKTFKLRRHR